MASEQNKSRDQRVSELQSQTVRGYVWSLGIGLGAAALVIGLAYLRR
jgi:hypothetical protein